jgi:hypothetical protein
MLVPGYPAFKVTMVKTTTLPQASAMPVGRRSWASTLPKQHVLGDEL